MKETLLLFRTEFYILASVLIISLISLAAMFTLFIKNNKIYNTIAILTISLAAGGLLGEVFIHILPESTAEQGMLKTTLLVLFGLVAFFILEKFLLWRNLKNKSGIKTVGQMSLLTYGIHNFMDGFVIGAAYLISIPLGIATTLAVCIHEIPMEIGEVGILVKSGFSRAQVILFNLASSSTAILGALLAIYIGVRLKNTPTLVFTFMAGAYIYIIGFGLFPLLKNELRSSRATGHFLAMGMGIGVMLLIACME